jgi:hypothetical protein
MIVLVEAPMTHRLALFLVCGLACAGADGKAQTAAAVNDLTATLVAIERGAMDRWARGDPSGYTDIFAPDVTIFDGRTQRRLNGLKEVVAYYEPIRGKVSIPRYEMVNPLVQVVDQAAILSYNFVAYSESNQVISRWNFTEVYKRTGGTWKVVHSHASYTQGRPAEKP